MKDVINSDNLYKEGSIICAKVDPSVKLVITKYRQRIYYCKEVDRSEKNNYVYFENELILPVSSDQVKLKS
jgi:hypothetical protein